MTPTKLALPLAKLQDELDALMAGGEDRVVAGVDLILAAGARANASDIHLEPVVEGLTIRFRLDGILRSAARVPREHAESVLARLKVISQLVTYRKKLPQDGRTRISQDGRDVDLRFSFFPTIRGEKAVLRFMSSARPLRGLDELGFSEAVKSAFVERLEKNSGTILLTGPAGSGKTTTMYAALRRVQSSREGGCSIMTIEDPVECDLGDISQSQVNTVAGINFASGLRSLLRQDPNVILLGEIRDRETAEIAAQAGLTGHLIISTIHSGSAVGVFSRLSSLGVEPFMIASSVSAILAQRLVPAICPYCREPHKPSAEVLRRLPKRGGAYYKGKGCASCSGTGTCGRVGLFELLAVDDDVKELVLRNAAARALLAALRRKGFKTMLDDGLEKARAGSVAVEEVLRAV